MSRPLVSIVIPTFNQGKFIGDCLESIKKQTFADFEVIIQDAMSTDSTSDVCRRYVQEDVRFKYFPEMDGGQSDAINKGLSRCQGKFWTWICSDDLYSCSSAISGLVSALLDSEDSCVGVFGDALYISESGERVADYFCIKGRVDKNAFKRVWPFSQPASLLKIKDVRHVGGVRNELHLGMDLDLFLRLLSESEECYFEYVPEQIASVRLHESSKSVALAKKTMVQAMRLQLQYFGPFFNLSDSIYLKTLAQLYWQDVKSIFYKAHLCFKRTDR